MKKLYIFFAATLLSIQLSSQVITWASTNNFPGQQKGLVTDQQSNLYIYGYTYWEVPEYNIKQGSVIRKYSNTGARLADITWNTGIFLNQMVYDGSGSFYFVGNFLGTVNLNGQTVTSKGELDGVIGKMDEWGKVIWLTSFGGVNDDHANGLTLNDNKTEIIVTGHADAEVNMGNNSIGRLDHALVLGVFDLNGNYKSHKTFDFDAQRHNLNIGLEIITRQDGYFLLADREGAEWWIEPLPPGPREGRYVFNLDKNFNITWSEFVISSACYYGYSCNSMSTSNGDVYLPKFCSGKYGGEGELCRRSGESGVPSFSITNRDGFYSDTYAYRNTVYYAGNEEANGCPCEANDPGFGIIKALDERNNSQLLFKKHGYEILHITRSLDGTIYVSGRSDDNDADLGGYTVKSGPFIFAMKDPINGPELDVKELVFNIFPNPASGKFEVTSETVIEQMEVMNLSGAVVFKNEPNAKTAAVTNLQPGYYAVRIKNGAATQVRKVVVGL